MKKSYYIIAILIFLFGFSKTYSQSTTCASPFPSIIGWPVNNSMGTLTNTRTTSGDIIPVNQMCGATYANGWDMTYKLTVTTAPVTVKITATSNTPGVQVGFVIKGIGAAACGSTSAAACYAQAASAGTCLSASTIYTFTVNNTYWIHVGSNVLAASNNTIELRRIIAPANDNCAGATVLTVGAACPSIATPNGDIFGASNSGMPVVCGGTGVGDVWHSFVAGFNTQYVQVVASSCFDPVVEVYAGTCAVPISIFCSDISFPVGGSGQMALTGLTVGATYYLRVYESTAFWTGTYVTQPATTTYSICINNPPTCPGNLGASTPVVLPLSTTSYTTCGKGDDIISGNASPVCGNPNYYNDEDDVITFTPAVSGQITITLSNTGANAVGMMLYEGCPFSGSCVGNSQSSSAPKVMCVPVVAGIQHYLVIDSWNLGANCFSYDLAITAPGGSVTGIDCAIPVIIGSFPFSESGTTQCFGNDYTNASFGSCGTLFESGEDKVFRYVSASAQCLSVSLTSSSTFTGIQVYSGCPGTIGTTCVGQANGNNINTTITLPVAGTYYFIIDSWAPPAFVTYTLNISSLGSGPVNDICSGAIPLTLGAVVQGTNQCSGGAGDAGVPACWVNGSLNTVWYRYTATSTANLDLRTYFGSLFNTQVAVYTAASCAGPFTSVGCNDNAPACGGSGYTNSSLLITGVTIGTTYYIMVDGNTNATGTFYIALYSGTAPAIYAQDCASPIPTCSSIMSFGNPGYMAYGNICDFNQPCTANCLASSERGSCWIQFNCIANGTVEFKIVPLDAYNPNPYTGLANPGYFSPFDETDYDYACWLMGSGGATCGTLCSTAPVRCHYSALGVTGFSNAPPAGFAGAFQSALPVLAGQTYIINVSNFANSTSGFTADFTGTTAGTISYTSPPTVYWTGAQSTDWVPGVNWGSCGPSCTVDAIIGAPFYNQPTVLSGTQSVRSLTINPGGQLSINSGATLQVCGNYTNLGTLIANTGSTVELIGAAAASMQGDMRGSNNFYNLIFNKTAGTVITLPTGAINDVEIDNVLTLTGGIVTTNGNKVNVLNNATGAVVGGNNGSYINGNLWRAIGGNGAYNFPVGDLANGKGYHLATTTFTGGTLPTQIQSRFDAWLALPGALGVTDCTYNWDQPALDNGEWTLTSVPAAVSAVYDITLNNNPTAYTNSGASAYWTVMKKPSAGAWALDGTCVPPSSTTNTVQRTGLTGFSEFATAQSSAILPIELLSVSGYNLDAFNYVEWITLSELNNAYFDVEFSADGKTFAEIARVSGNGTSQIEHDYRTIHRYPVVGNNFYRIKQVDFDGFYSYSSVINIRYEKPMIVINGLLPNPTSGITKLALYIPEATNIEIEVYDMFGKLMIKKMSFDVSGNYLTDFDMTSFSKGVYYVKVVSNSIGFSAVEKLVVE